MSRPLVRWEYIVGKDGTTWKAHNVTSGTAEYSKPLRVHFSTGHSALLVLCSGGSDDVDINFQVSLDGISFYAPVDNYGTDMSRVGVAITSDSWIVFSPQLAEYIRFKVDPDANSTITCIYIQQE